MASEKGATFPAAAIGVVALLMSTLLLAERPFDLPRLGEADTAKLGRVLQPPVAARLWEDPFAALKRYREKVKDRCYADRFTVGLQSDPACDGGWPRLQGKTTVIAVLLRGEDFVGAEEARRRTRYAVMTGLGEEGFLPENSERIGFVRKEVCNWLGRCEGPAFDVPYDTLSTDEASPQHALVLWIDDAAIGRNWLRNLTALLATVPALSSPELRIIGPYDSAKLKDALDYDLTSLERQINPHSSDVERERFGKNLRALDRITVINPSATAAVDALLGVLDRSSQARHGSKPAPRSCATLSDCVDHMLASRLDEIGGRLNYERDEANRTRKHFVSTIGTDDLNVKLLVNELCARGIAAHEGSRVVLLREWDTIYTRTMSQALVAKLQEPAPCETVTGSKANVDVKLYSYLRGLDGANVDGASKEQRLVPRPAGDKDKTDAGKEPQIEWPETRDQRDYVRRLVDRMRYGADGNGAKIRISAIGLLGSDVHDKLVLAQALRPTFPSEVLFTTDIDARLVHPEVLPYTRNLVVASSLPLEPPFLGNDKDRGVRVPPFRDGYQTATFFAARYAVASERLKDIEGQLKDGHLFEIGRRGAIELGISKPAEGEAEGRTLYGRLSIVVLIVLAWLILFSRPGPAMKASRSPDRAISVRRFKLATAVLCSMTVAALGFGAGVVAELLAPGRVRLSGILVIALISAVLFLGFRYPGIGAPPSRFRYRHRRMVRAWRWRWALRIVVPFVVVAAAAWLRHSPLEQAMPEPFAAAEGVSVWPSQLLRTLAIVLFPWCLDFAWNKGIDIGRGIGRTFFDYKPRKPKRYRPPVSLMRCRWRIRRLRQRLGLKLDTIFADPKLFVRTRVRRTRHGFAAASVWFWRPQLAWHVDKRVDGRRLWQAYLLMSRNPLRVRRLFCWVVVTVGLVGMIATIVGGPWPDVPARGIDDRALFVFTIFAATAATLILLVLATNAALLTWRLILIMSTGRTVYPRATVQRFAAELGPRIPLAPHLYYPVAARTYDRGKPGFDARNSLFDPWIDARFLAKHTEAVSRLIYFPFVLLALLIVSRSRVFDNWPIGGPVTIALGCYLLWAVAIAALLNYGAETARHKAIDSLEKDLLWLKGAGPMYQGLTDEFPKLIDQVRDLREGAFAPFSQQPLVRAIFVPLGIGGVQLLELLILGR